MSFSKSKVERFPLRQASPSDPNRKRPYAISNSIMLGPSSYVTLPSKDNAKQKTQKLPASDTRFLTRSNKKLSVQRDSVVKKASKVTPTKPGNLSFHCSAVKDISSFKLTPKYKRLNTPPSATKVSKNHETGSIGKVSEDLWLCTSPKRQKIDETENEKYFTPLTSPPHILYVENIQENETKGVDSDSAVQDYPDTNLVTLTPSPPAKSLKLFEIPQQSTRIHGNENVSEKLDEGLCLLNNELEDTAITICRRNSDKRCSRSFHSESPLSANVITNETERTPLSIQLSSAFLFARNMSFTHDHETDGSIVAHSSAWNVPFDLGNSTLLNVSLKDSTHSDQQLLITNWAEVLDDRCYQDQQAGHNTKCSTPSESMEAGSVPKKPFILFLEKIQNVFLYLLHLKTTRSLADRSIVGRGLNTTSGFEQRKANGNLPLKDTLVRRRDWQNDISLMLSQLSLGRATQIYRPSREMRRLIRIVRNETRRTAREIQVCVIVPAKLFVQSEQFWMPIMEFAAGQAIEVIQTSIPFSLSNLLFSK